MTSTRSSSTNTKTRSATRRIESFRQRFGDGHFYLACHAALPLALTPDLLYSLWANFQRDDHGEAIEIPWIAVADLMLSNLCKEVGNELYEMDQPIRDDLLNQLQNDSRFGLERLQALADFVMAYVEQQLDSPDLDIRDLATGQKWRALAYKHPSEAAHSIATVLAQLSFDDKAEWIRMAALLNSLEEPLSAFQPLLNYIRAMADLSRGNLAAATAQMTQVVDANREVRVEGVTLPIPDVLNGASPRSQESDVLPTSPPNRLKMPIAIAGATVISLLILVGVQYGLRSPTPQPTSVSSATPTPQPGSAATPITQPSVAAPSPVPSPTFIKPSPSSSPSVPATPPSQSLSPVATPTPKPSVNPSSKASSAISITPSSSPSSSIQAPPAQQNSTAQQKPQLSSQVSSMPGKNSSISQESSITPSPSPSSSIQAPPAQQNSTAQQKPQLPSVPGKNSSTSKESLLQAYLNGANEAKQAEGRTKAKQAEARTYVGAMTRSQQAYFLEKDKFSSNIPDLGLGMSTETPNYSYKTQTFGSGDKVYAINTATPKQDGLKSYVGGVYFDGVFRAMTNTLTAAILCESTEPSRSPPMSPQLVGNDPQCAPGSVDLSK
ncbi:hypothetical protein JOY44_21120 [Phormidium sp. CLA17]|uniref:type IV pilin-like G/H family protein n=1 Tax=Leptolyngbya sp. Cla-17 TaxID=2803751 RepID=UPI0014920422|nr:type IV pilin-like G/H family protein [Leptolyngbya sp. Cla-17]MBM0744089.1 hypothetical protein [Leptolyngbya sp. Cla-17]